MAIYNEILTGRYARALQKLFQIKGTVPAKQLAGELMAIHPLFNGNENRYLEGWFLFGMSQNVAGTAGNAGAVRLRNPANSKTVAVIQKLYVITTGADFPFIDHGIQTADLGTVTSNNNTRLDPRGQQGPQCALSGASPGASFGTSACQLSTPANVGVDALIYEDMALPLLPGDAYQTRCQTLNNAITTTFWWRERLLEDSELT